MSFSINLKRLREREGLSQAALASRLGVGIGSVGMWESTERIPPSKKLVQIADFFGVTTDELLDRKKVGQVASQNADSILSAEEKELLALYRKLLPNYRAAILQNARLFAGEADKTAFPKKA